ncbi:MAG: hypothetical protein EBT59_15140 [Betaproteobacteria bacterium]|nr:hypothetical protein [Betaproteobacteria bacterium]
MANGLETSVFQDDVTPASAKERHATSIGYVETRTLKLLELWRRFLASRARSRFSAHFDAWAVEAGDFDKQLDTLH